MEIIILASAAVLFYVLYRSGYFVTQTKSALMYIDSFRRGSATASFTSCSGYVKRALPFCGSRTYCFTLCSDISKGDFHIEIQDKAKRSVLRLYGNASGQVQVEKKDRYYLVVHFDHADGRYELRWDDC